jgi:hypothetical protein
MNPSLQNDILNRLSEFNFKHEKGGYLRGGTCPQCHKKELYTNATHPWVLRCGRLNNCGYEGHVKQIYPDLFNDWSKRYAELIPQNPNAIADAYLQHGRGFDLSIMRGTYKQESYFDPELKISSATVRFSVGSGYWERLIDKPDRFGKKKARFGYESGYQGLWWVSPSTLSQLPTIKELWLVEGIFDAIALEHHGIAAAALMSCNNYPSLALQKLKESSNMKCRLVWALDSDTAGQRFLKKHIDRAREGGWHCEAAQIPQRGKVKLDWNDLHQRDRLSEIDIANYRYNGALLIAKSASEKALLIYGKENKLEFDFEFKNRLFWFDLSLAEYTKQMEQLDKEEDGTSSEETKREKALYASHNIRPIANCNPTALYYQKNDFTDEAWYYFRVDFPHDGASVKNTFTSAQIASATEFKKRLLGIAPGAMYSGTSAMLDRMMERDLFHIKRVETIDYIGYSKEHGCYIFDDLATKDSVLYEINGEDFYDIGRTAIKSLNKSVSLTINKDPDSYTTEWVTHLWNAFGAKGLVALAFWFGTLFAEQIRATQSSYPFLEIVGKAGAGKSTLIEFLWKLFGRISYEGFDPSKSSLAGRARNFSQVSGLPVVLIESDRERMDSEKSHVKLFDWDELKTAFNGRSTRARGMNTGGNETYEPPFRGAIVISQNNPVIASEAILSRIVHLYFDLSTQTPESGMAADFLKFMPAESVSGFILRATKCEKKVLEKFTERTAVYLKELRLRQEIKMPRLIETHAQMLALTDALALVIQLSAEQQNAMREQIILMAVERQKVINDDHPLVQEFWETFDYLDSNEHYRLNHSRDPQLIAVNLNNFIQAASESRQQIPMISDLKKVLKTSRRRKYIEMRTVNSPIKAKENQLLNSSTSTKCWMFKNEQTAHK